MDASYPQLTPEQRQAVPASGGLPIQFEDRDTHKRCALVELPQNVTLDDEYTREELSKGIAALETDGRLEWDPGRIKQEGRRRLAAKL